MNGTLLNIVTVALGSLIGLMVGNRLPKRMQESIITGLGLMTLFVGLSNAAKTGNPMIPLIATLIGVIFGEALRIDVALEALAGWLQMRLTGRTPTLDDAPSPTAVDNRERFITGFVTASLVFCIGPLTFAGSIQDGMGIASGFQMLAIKSALDFFGAMAFASSFGVGVLATCLTIFVVQGGLALFGMALARLMNGEAATTLAQNPMILEMTSVGGILLIGLSLILLDLKKPRMANFLPALFIAPLIVFVLQTLLHIQIYPDL